MLWVIIEMVGRFLICTATLTVLSDLGFLPFMEATMIYLGYVMFWMGKTIKDIPDKKMPNTDQ